MFETNDYGRIMKTDVSDISTLDIYCKNAATVKMDYEKVINLTKKVLAEIELGLNIDFFDEPEKAATVHDILRADTIDFNPYLEPEKAVNLGLGKKVRAAMKEEFNIDTFNLAGESSVQEHCLKIYNEASEKLDKDKKILEELKPLVMEKYGIKETELDEKIENTEVILPPLIIMPSSLPGY